MDVFTTAPILRHYDPELPIMMLTDSSRFTVAAMLSPLYIVERAMGVAEATDAVAGDNKSAYTKIQRGVVSQPEPSNSIAQVGEYTGRGDEATSQGYLAAFWSRQMTSTERDYNTGEQKLLTIMMACKQ